jgi:multidrug transporter EmrE-like cation transporter
MSDLIQTLLDDSAFRFGMAMGVVETVSDASLKAYAQTDNSAYLATTIGGYGGVLYLFQRALRKEKLYRVNNYWNAFTSVSNTIVGVAMGESINNTQILGVALIACGILLV